VVFAEECPTFSPDSTRVLIGCADGTVQVWDAATGKSVTSLMRHQGQVLAAKFNPDGRYVLSVGIDRTARLWDLATAWPDRRRLPHASAVYEAAFSPDGRILATMGRDGTVLWDLPTTKPVGPPLLPPESFWTQVVTGLNPDGRFLLDWRKLVNDRKFEARIWDLATRKAVGVPLRHHFPGGNPTTVGWSQSGRRVATVVSGGSGASMSLVRSQVGVWEAETGAPVTPVLAFDACIQGVEFSPDGKLLAMACGIGWDLVQKGEARILDAETGAARVPTSHTPYTCRMVRFSPDGRRLVTASAEDSGTDGEAPVWDVASGEPVTVPLHHTAMVASAEFSPDGRFVLTASEDGTAQIWDATTGARALAPMQHRYPVHSAVFSRDGRSVLTTSSPSGWLAENRVYAQVWDATTGQPVTPPFWHTRAITSAAFSPDGRSVATTSYGDGAQVWKLAPDPRPLDDWFKLAEVLSGTKLDASGAMRPIDRSELREAYRASRSQDPGVFTASPDQVLDWHDRKALACETAGAWEAALGHLNMLIATGRGVEALRLRRAEVHAELDHWREAAEDYRSLGLTEWVINYWHRLALVELASGNRDGYRAACTAMLRQSVGGANGARTANNLAWACSLAPETGVDTSQVVSLAEAAVAHRMLDSGSPSQLPVTLITLGAALYRAGRYEEAVRRMSEAGPAGGVGGSPQACLLLAMAHHRLDHADEARSWLARAEAGIRVAEVAARYDPRNSRWSDRLESRLLHREAAALLGLADLPADVFARP
jgi:WD40 repeat protein